MELLKAQTLQDQPLSEPSDLDPDSTALFFDFDGTLVEIAQDPSAVVLRHEIRDILTHLYATFGGAVAVVSGRPVAEVDSFLRPLRLPLAGVHGLEVQPVDGPVERHAYDRGKLERLIASVRAFTAPHAGLLVEAKGGAVALHYRKRPELEDDVRRFARSCLDTETGVELVHGKMVAELRLGGRTKADAVSRFMNDAPFAGRTPWFFGDDVTDEDAFSRINDLGGRSVKIGPGETHATARFDTTAAFHDWLSRLAAAGEVADAHAGAAR